MDKEMTGRLIAEARKEKRLTQQELAEKLHITGKAVSKWETGVSVPDIGLLIPLAEILGLSVTELLEGRRAVAPEDRTPEQVEDIVKTAIAFSEDAPEKRQADRKKRGLIYAICVLIAAIEAGLLWRFDMEPLLLDNQICWMHLFFGVFFGAYFMLFALERLPGYYDDNEINYYVHGMFRIHMPGMTFNNRNWPYILGAIRLWAMLTTVLIIPAFVVLFLLFPPQYFLSGQYVIMALSLGGLVIAEYVANKKG